MSILTQPEVGDRRKPALCWGLVLNLPLYSVVNKAKIKIFFGTCRSTRSRRRRRHRRTRRSPRPRPGPARCSSSSAVGAGGERGRAGLLQRGSTHPGRSVRPPLPVSGEQARARACSWGEDGAGPHVHSALPFHHLEAWWKWKDDIQSSSADRAGLGRTPQKIGVRAAWGSVHSRV